MNHNLVINYHQPMKTFLSRRAHPITLILLDKPIIRYYKSDNLWVPIFSILYQRLLSAFSAYSAEATIVQYK